MNGLKFQFLSILICKIPSWPSNTSCRRKFQ